jgi:hypothetical protein
LNVAAEIESFAAHDDVLVNGRLSASDRPRLVTFSKFFAK